VDYISGLPIYFRYIPGNVVDKSTLIPTIKILHAYDIDIDLLLMDAGYYSNDNIEEMLSLDLPFVLIMPENNKIFTDVLFNHGQDLKIAENAVEYGARALFVKKVKIQISEKDCYAYLCLDPTKEAKETTKFLRKNLANSNFIEKYNEHSPYFGKFLILSNKDIPTEQIIATYYARTKIEQIFDFAKNMTGLIPLGVHSEDVFKGHMLLSFIATILYSLFHNKLSKQNICCTDLLYDLSELRIEIFENDKHIIRETCKSQRIIIEALGLEYPFHVRAGNLRKAQAILNRKSKGRRGRPKGSKGKQKFKVFPEEPMPTDPTTVDVPKGKPGRPPGSKNKPKALGAESSSATAAFTKGKPGRPPGSKN
jgi:transposase